MGMKTKINTYELVEKVNNNMQIECRKEESSIFHEGLISQKK